MTTGGGAVSVLSLYGLIVGHDSGATFVPPNTADDWLHFALGIGMIAPGALLTRRPHALPAGCEAQMRLRKSLWAAAAGLAAGAVVVTRRVQASPPARTAADRWLTVTINCQPGEVHPGKLPAPLQEYGERIETRIRPAPGDRGTELAVRLKEPRPRTAHSVPARLAGEDPRQDLRRALREAKSLLEAGEILRPDVPPTTHDTPGGKLVGLLGRRAGGEGVL